MTHTVGLRWTIGDVSAHGFHALGLSIRGAWRVFGTSAAYAVCVNTVGAEEARRRLGPLPMPIAFLQVDRHVPRFVRERFDERFAEGVGWKFAPPRLFQALPEIALDNDCILWEMPGAVRRWLDDPRPHICLIAADVAPAFGRFAPWCGDEPRNSGIRGLKPGFDLVAALREVLSRVDGTLTSELDEQGLQVAAVSLYGRPYVVPVDDVAICGPLPPHSRERGRCGAHFVGLNAHALPWEYLDRRGHSWVRAHYRSWREDIERRVNDARESTLQGDFYGTSG